MDRRAFLAIFLIMLVLVVPLFFSSPAPQSKAAGTAPAPRIPATDTVPAAALPVQQRAPVADAQPAAEALVTVESPLYRFTFSNHGARLVRAELKHFRSFAPGH